MTSEILLVREPATEQVLQELPRAGVAEADAAITRAAAAWPELTDSELAVVGLVARGATNREIAERLYVSPYTVNSHLRHVFVKLGIHSRVELVFMATERGVAP